MTEENELLTCWKCCCDSAIFVDHAGYYSEINKGFVSCNTFNCINERKIFTVEEWQNHDRENNIQDYEQTTIGE